MEFRSTLLVAALLAASFGTTQAHAGITPRAPHPNLLPSCGEGDPNPPIQDVVRLRPARTLGTTPEEIHAKFANVVEANFTHGSPSQIMSRLSDKELAGIARVYKQSNAGRPPKLLDIMASRLSAKDLVRVAGTFGVSDVSAAVQRSASPSVAMLYTSRVAAGEVKIPTTIMPMSGPAPTRYMTLEEIYLEFRTAPVGSLGPGAALSETVIYAGGNLIAAWGVGSAIGTGIATLIQDNDPDAWDAIGGTTAGVVERVQNAANDISNTSGTQRGVAEHSADGMFNYPVSNSFNFYGDWDVSDDMGNDMGMGCFN
ncbi:hypothetical protein RKE25_02540 [Dyella sp. BiH032]|uniref:hypothetical protein n=1 Tax=Dyella sp. BiH032 TaxID=3075430 RepID=UPI0028930E5D|nr:hypothetical protein [Dyella sp. BiH032]WNL46534.1 hypothetical protein RKE25_02540 [Dyella sp. BiH032]